MKFSKKLIEMVLIIALPITSIYISSCSENYKFEHYMDVIAINDFHGAAEIVMDKSGKITIPGIEYLASEISNIRAENYQKTGTYDSTQVILNGDIFQGTGFSELTYGDSVAELFQTLGIRFSSIGNHEFDWGQDFLDLNQARQKKHLTFQQMGDFTFLSCNIHKTSITGDLINWADVQPYTILECQDFKLAIIGYTTPETKITTSRAYVDDLFFGSAEQSPNNDVENVINDIDNLPSNQKPDSIALLAHEGDELDEHGDFSTQRLQNIVDNTTGIQVIYSAHTHQIYKKVLTNSQDGTSVQVGQAGKNATNILRTRYYYDDDKIGNKLEKVEMIDPKDTAIDVSTPINDIIKNASVFLKNTIDTFNKWQDITNKLLDKRIFILHSDNAICTAHWPDDEVDSVYPLPSLFTDQLFSELSINGSAYGYVGSIDCALMNTGAFKTDLQPGDVAYRNMYSIFPYNDYPVMLQMTVSQLITCINTIYDHGSYSYLPTIGGPQNNADRMKMVFSGGQDGEVTAIQKNGVNLAESTTINVLTNDYLAGGGDKSTFNTLIPIWDDQGIDEREMIINSIGTDWSPVFDISNYLIK